MTIASRIRVVLATGLLTVGLLTSTGAATAQPVQMAGAYGTVHNQLPSNYTVKTARFLSSGTSSCQIWNAEGWMQYRTWNCNTRWLPSGQSSDELFGWWYDADGFMVESWHEVYFSSDGSSTWVPPFVWTRIHDWNTATCYQAWWSDNHPFCYISS